MESTGVSELAHHQDEDHDRGDTHQDHVLVRVITTAGAYPRTGENRVKAKILISAVLADAANDLRLTDTSTWVATEGGRNLDTGRTFDEAGLHGKVKIHWGPSEGGGG